MARFSVYQSLSILVVLLSLSPFASGQQHRRIARQSSASNLPSQSNFLRRAYHASIVVGDWVYIDGGEFTQLVNGQVAILTLNATLSIDLRSSWTNSTVTLNQISKAAPVLDDEILWLGADNASFYQWGGHVSGVLVNTSAPTNNLWRFIADGNGGGSWTQIATGIAGLLRTAHSLFAAANGIGYSAGGDVSSGSDQTINYVLRVPGLIAYDMSTGTFTNTTSQGMTASGTAADGVLISVPQFSQLGILVALGGYEQTGNLIGFNTVSMYDISSSTWVTQATSGNIPSAREDFCAVGVAGQSSFEIFMMGGYDNNNVLDEIYVLSLPSFQWSKANYSSINPRTHHSCNLVGNRQMLVIGGTPSHTSWYSAEASDTNYQDPWPYGLGVFDLSAMQWSPQYNASAAPYITSEVVQAGIKSNGSIPSSWSSNGVQSIFSISRLGQNTTSSNTNSSSSSSSTSHNSSKSSSSTSLDGSAIAGVVIALIAALAFAALLIWYFCLRNRRTSIPHHENFSHTKDASSLGSSPYSTLNSHSPNSQQYRDSHERLRQEQQYAPYAAKGLFHTLHRHQKGPLLAEMDPAHQKLELSGDDAGVRHELQG